MGFRFLACPTVFERASDWSSQSRVGLLGLPRLAGGIPPAADGVTGAFTKKASLPPPKYHCKSILQYPQS